LYRAQILLLLLVFVGALGAGGLVVRIFRGGRILVYFALTLFVSATLLFLVQPMIGKMILPQLGGTPAVWNTCMVFFQAVLLVGYGYTHLITTTQPTNRQVIIQCCLLFSPFLLFMLPFSLGDWVPETEGNPIFSLLIKLSIMVGLPFFMVSTTAPLLQKWFFHTGHPAAKDPYFLYGASNLGSMLGLLMYPTLIEPFLPVSPPEDEDIWQTQVHLWSIGYAIFVGLVVGCAYVVYQALLGKLSSPAELAEAMPDSAPTPEPAPAPAPPPAPSVAPATAITASKRRRGARMAPTPEPAPAAASLTPPAPSIVKPVPRDVPNDDITLWRRLRWIGLAAAPSSLMLGVTTHLTTDIAAIAFFWIIPLTLYLMTFIFVFSRWPWVWTGTPHTVVMFIQPCLVLFLVLKLIANLSPPTWAEFLLHLGAFFSTTLMCHGELAKDRPSTKHLTEFYFWMSLGGVLGGLFNALFAPIVFQLGLWEYLVAIAFACVLRSNLVEDEKTLIPYDSNATRTTPFGYVLDFGVPIIMGLLGYGLTYVGDFYSGGSYDITRTHLLISIGVLFVIFLGCFYYFGAQTSQAGREPPIDLIKRHGQILLGVAAFALLLCAVIYFKNISLDVGGLVRRSYFLAVIVVIVLALSLRPVRFGLSIAALFIAMLVYERVYDKFVYEGRGFFGLLRVRESPLEAHTMPRLYGGQALPTEYKVYRTLIHGGINHGRQIVQYQDDRANWPVLTVSTIGLLGSPFSEGPTIAALALFPEGERDKEEYARHELIFKNEELMLRKRREPITYFYERNGVAELFYKLTWPKAQPVSEIANMNGASDARLTASMVALAAGDAAPFSMLVNTQSEPPYAIVGLGTGIQACYAKPYQHVDIYEIDPLVKNLSVVPGYIPKWHADRPNMKQLPDPTFYFVQDAMDRGAKIDVKLGDGRLKIKDAPEGYYHIIALDAFSSDAIPVHLLTKDAVKLYLSKLAEGGVLIFNTTNRYVRIEGVLASIAQDLDLNCLHCPDYTYNADHPDRFSADWVVLQRKVDRNTYKSGGLPIRERLEEKRIRLGWDGKPIKDSSGNVLEDERWRSITPLPGPAWTDGYSNMLNPRVMPWIVEWKRYLGW
jgi:hypothetical protein